MVLVKDYPIDRAPFFKAMLHILIKFVSRQNRRGSNLKISALHTFWQYATQLCLTWHPPFSDKVDAKFVSKVVAVLCHYLSIVERLYIQFF